MEHITKVLDFIKSLFFFTTVALVSLLALFALWVKGIFTE
jgi:hypothetical protein